MAEVNLNDISSNSDASRKNQAPPKTDNTDLIQYEPIKKVNPFIRVLNFFGINTELDGAGAAIWQDVIVPTFLDGCRDSVYTAADYIFGGSGNARKNSQGKRQSKSGYTAYGSKSTSKQPNRSPNVNSYFMEFDERSSDDPNNPGAQDVLDQMRDVVDAVGSVSIQDMITIAKKTTSNYTLGDWGWTDLSRVMVRTTSNRRFKIDLPKPVYLKED